MHLNISSCLLLGKIVKKRSLGAQATSIVLKQPCSSSKGSSQLHSASLPTLGRRKLRSQQRAHLGSIFIGHFIIIDCVAVCITTPIGFFAPELSTAARAALMTTCHERERLRAPAEAPHSDLGAARSATPIWCHQVRLRLRPASGSSVGSSWSEVGFELATDAGRHPSHGIQLYVFCQLGQTSPYLIRVLRLRLLRSIPSQLTRDLKPEPSASSHAKALCLQVVAATSTREG